MLFHDTCYTSSYVCVYARNHWKKSLMIIIGFFICLRKKNCHLADGSSPEFSLLVKTFKNFGIGVFEQSSSRLPNFSNYSFFIRILSEPLGFRIPNKEL